MPSEQDDRNAFDTDRNAFARRACIAHLPTEILLIIFKHVHSLTLAPLPPTVRHASIGGIHAYDDEAIRRMLRGPRPPGLRRPEDLRSPSLFPYALADVCPRWHAVLGMVPEFWTRLVINVDDSPSATPLSDVQSHLEWSKDLPLEVTVWRYDRDYEGGDAEGERIRVEAVNKLLVLHFPRLTAVRFDVSQALSFPPFGVGPLGRAENLLELSLLAHVGRGGWDHPLIQECTKPWAAVLGACPPSDNRVVLRYDPGFPSLPRLGYFELQCACAPERESIFPSLSTGGIAAMVPEVGRGVLEFCKCVLEVLVWVGCFIFCVSAGLGYEIYAHRGSYFDYIAAPFRHPKRLI
ncbi:hypothetical protein PLICRDRAFT_57389 [Plicaturopsis crispa FD-325 SS-3]|uniref:F-box domain-containing protein n=1 Tax=Plicaturopsis crispa FD-325 SS-3 TaxID=944288 RepID=A0A0C9T9E9_PLICR|nr:hypothetical protein PLICRDRAFT_57389 [Plicaturopsis crispa FD-325 SS-3]